MTTLDDPSEKLADLRRRNTAAVARWRSRQRGDDAPLLRRGRPPRKPAEGEVADSARPAETTDGTGHED